MSRTGKARLGYLIAFVVLFVGAVAVLRSTEPSYGLLLAVLLLVPGRIQGVLLRELFRGRRYLDRGEPARSVESTQAFLERLARDPWRARAPWLSAWVYTPDAGAMALNNLGAAKLELGDLDAAEQALSEALERDRLYALPWVNRAVVAMVRGREHEGERCWRQARKLGWRGGWQDAVVRRAQSLLARFEGRPLSDPSPDDGPPAADSTSGDDRPT